MTKTLGQKGSSPLFFVNITLLSNRISCHDNPLWNWPQLVFVISVPTSALVSIWLVIPSHPWHRVFPSGNAVKINSSMSITVLFFFFSLLWLMLRIWVAAVLQLLNIWLFVWLFKTLGTYLTSRTVLICNELKHLLVVLSLPVCILHGCGQLDTVTVKL